MAKNRPLSNLVETLDDFPDMIGDIIQQQGMARVLEIGCGFGLPMIQLHYKFGNSLFLYGINLNHWECSPRHAVISGKQINVITDQQAEEVITGKHNNKYLLADAGVSLPFPSNTFDLIYSRTALGFVKDKVRCVEEIYRVLKPGSVFRCDISLISVPHPSPWDTLFIVVKNSKDHSFWEFLGDYTPVIQLRKAASSKTFIEIQKIGNDSLDLGLEFLSAIDLQEILPDLCFAQSRFAFRNPLSTKTS